MITREEFCNTLNNNLTDNEIDILLDRITSNEDSEEIIFHYLNETALIFNTYNNKYISWYKISHIGRSIDTNINDICELDMFVQDIKEVLS